MIITRTPLRISFLGGGTDYPDYYRLHGGQTVATSVRQYTVVVVNRLTRFVDYRFRIHYSTVESVATLDEIRHPSARECLRFLGIDGGVEIHYISDLPARTGLGSSSSATVGLLHALHTFKEESVSPDRLAEEAVHIEQNCIRERVGSQDQYICALGGMKRLKFRQDGSVSAETLVLSPRRLDLLERSLLLLYTGKQRTAHDVLAEQMERTVAGDNAESLRRLGALVDQAIDVLNGADDLAAFGELLHAGWMIKRGLSSKVSEPWIDDQYDRARRAGALGGKLLGAGGGGFLLLFVSPDCRQKVIRALPELRVVDCEFDELGTHIMFHRTESQALDVRPWLSSGYRVESPPIGHSDT